METSHPVRLRSNRTGDITTLDRKELEVAIRCGTVQPDDALDFSAGRDVWKRAGDTKLWHRLRPETDAAAGTASVEHVTGEEAPPFSCPGCHSAIPESRADCPVCFQPLAASSAPAEPRSSARIPRTRSRGERRSLSDIGVLILSLCTVAILTLGLLLSVVGYLGLQDFAHSDGRAGAFYLLLLGIPLTLASLVILVRLPVDDLEGGSPLADGPYIVVRLCALLGLVGTIATGLYVLNYILSDNMARERGGEYLLGLYGLVVLELTIVPFLLLLFCRMYQLREWACVTCLILVGMVSLIAWKEMPYLITPYSSLAETMVLRILLYGLPVYGSVLFWATLCAWKRLRF